MKDNMINIKQTKKFCKDDISKIENYDKAVNDPTQTWVIHHRLELTLDGEFALTVKQLQMHDMYYNRPYYELIFLTKSEHTKLHSTGKVLSDYTKAKIANSIRGENHHQYGKPLSIETKSKISKANKGRIVSTETRRKLSIANSGKPSYNKGKSMSAEQKQKIAAAVKQNWLKRKQALMYGVDENEEQYEEQKNI